MQPHAVARAHSGADTGLPGVKQRRLASFGNRLIERIGHPVIWKEALHGGMKLEALDSKFLDEPPRLARAELTLGWINRRKRNQNIAVLAGEFGDFLVLISAVPGLPLCIDRKDHGRDILLSIMRRRLRNGRRMAPTGTEILRHARL